MRIIPVIDLLGGVVVRGIGGLRDQYRPIESRLVDSTDPLTVARAIRDRLNLSYLYVADLDAIRTGTASDKLIRPLVDDGFELLVDAGAATRQQVEDLFCFGATEVVIGLETLSSPDVLGAAARQFGERVVFSLDLNGNWPVTPHDSPWAGLAPDEIADQAVALGITRMIVLDLHRVGRGTGIATLDLCVRILNRHPSIRLITGGGVRNRDDLKPLEAAGVDGVLIASALHDGGF